MPLLAAKKTENDKRKRRKRLLLKCRRCFATNIIILLRVKVIQNPKYISFVAMTSALCCILPRLGLVAFVFFQLVLPSSLFLAA